MINKQLGILFSCGISIVLCSGMAVAANENSDYTRNKAVKSQTLAGHKQLRSKKSAQKAVRQRSLYNRSSHVKVRGHAVSSAQAASVVALIQAQAPRQAVPTWFALRIAKVESNYNPNARGAAGEYGVYQLKCNTAKGLGFRGPCSQLLNASTNINYGLKHLALALRMSKGNLHLAASKHNGGLGTRRMVQTYIKKVF